jgi:DNA excision repair protein ERCC-3
MLSDECSFFKTGANFSKLYREKKWDGRRRFFSSATHMFPTGLISNVIGIMKKLGCQYKIHDCRIKPEKEFGVELEGDFSYRTYQQMAVEGALTAQRGILRLATAAGKNFIAMNIAQRLGVKTLFISNTREALSDTLQTANTCFPGIPIGVYGGGKKMFGPFITVCTMATMIKSKKEKVNGATKTTYLHLDKFKEQNFQCVFIDECHHVGSKSWFKAVMEMDSFYKFGLTGTDFRTDGGHMFLKAVTGRKIIDIGARELIDQGYLVEPNIYFVDVIMEPFNYATLTYQDIYTGGIIHNEVRNNIIVDIVKKNLGKSILVVFEKLEHGDVLYEKIKQIDNNCKLITGKTKKREALKKMFTEGEIRTVLASRIYNESVDIPILEVVVNAAGGKSGIQVLQRIGRSLRKNPEDTSKTKSIIYDFNDAFNNTLEQHSEERQRWITKEEFKFRRITNVGKIGDSK